MGLCGVPYTVRETYLLSNKYSTSKFHKLDFTGTTFSLRKNKTENTKQFGLEIFLPQVSVFDIKTRSRLQIFFCSTQDTDEELEIFEITLKQLYFDKHDWVEMKVNMAEFNITGSDILDELYPKHSVNVQNLTNNSGSAWEFGLTNPTEKHAIILYHMPEQNQQHIHIMVDMEKAMYGGCGKTDLNLPQTFGQVCVSWKSVLRFSKQSMVHTISLPGTKTEKLRLTHTTESNSSSVGVLHVYWREQLCPFTNSSDPRCVSFCAEDLHFEDHTSFHYTQKDTSYHYVHLVQHFCERTSDLKRTSLASGFHSWFDMNISRQLNGTWNEASQLCKSHGGTLPIIRNKQELDQIITLSQCTLTVMEVMFIGLCGNPVQKVCVEDKKKRNLFFS